MPRDPRQARSRARVDAIVAAAAALILDQGPTAISHRAVAAAAGVPLAATTYYFADLGELLARAGEQVAQQWIERAEAVAAQAGAGAGRGTAQDRAALVCEAVLPPGDDVAVRAHYEHLVGAGASPALAQAYANARERLDAAVGLVLERIDSAQRAELAIAVVDGAAVSALSEGRPVRPHAAALVALAI
ncbi:MAG: hypothetical protein ACTMIR_05815 [Cellulomonadaceae bacterium]